MRGTLVWEETTQAGAAAAAQAKGGVSHPKGAHGLQEEASDIAASTEAKSQEAAKEDERG